MYRNFNNKTTGFTLIELLVVIAIIGILSSIVISSLNSARVKSRDAQRVAFIRELQKALEMYYIDNGSYPLSGGATSPNGGWTNSNDGSWTTLATSLEPYLKRLSPDPINTSSSWVYDVGNYSYAYFSRGYGCDGGWYMLLYRTERLAVSSPGSKACDGTNFNYGNGAITVGAGSR